MTIPPRIAGIDEVGRGPLAGPVLAAAVIIHARAPKSLLALLDDSKKLSPQQRTTAAAALLEAARAGHVEIAVAAASVTEIARINILQATFLAMTRAVARLSSPPDLALVDGNKAPPLPCPARCIIGGDASEPAISAASIIAKVIRDRAMARLAVRYPGYGWERNSGYGAPIHLEGLRRLGITPHHRTTFGTVRQLSLGL